MIKYVILLFIFLTSCSSVSHISEVRVEYSDGVIYMVDEGRFLVFRGSKFYYIEYFKMKYS